MPGVIRYSVMRRCLTSCFTALLLFTIGFIFRMQQLFEAKYKGTLHVNSLMKANFKWTNEVLGRPSHVCRDFMREVSNGTWREKRGLTEKDVLERQEMDRKIRVANNWPAVLFRNDSRCGKNFSLPGYRIQSLCDPDSPSPCCDTKTGRCGISESHCKCPECTDLREMKSAELLEWVPQNPACRIKDFTTEEACDFLNKHKLRLAFIGDSLVRQLSTTALLLLSGNWQSGSMPAKASQSDLERCPGELQMTERDCSIDITTHKIEELPKNSVCKGKVSFTLDTIEDYGSRLQGDVINKTREMLTQTNSYLILGVGLHYDLAANFVISNFLNTITRLIQKEGNGWPVIIWVEIHSLNGFLRMETKFQNSRIEDYNKVINNYLDERDIPIIRTFDKSSNLKSYDGQHYGVGFNLHKLQMILNYLHRKHEIRGNKTLS